MHKFVENIHNNFICQMVIHPKENIKQVRRDGMWGEWVTILDRVAKRKPHHKKATAEQRPGGGERMSQAAIWRRAFQAESKGSK